MPPETLTLTDVLAGLVGERCAGVDNPYGSVLRLDIGPLELPAGASADERPHGWRHLTVYSPWRLTSETDVLCDWNDDGGAKGHLTQLITVLHGQAIVSANSVGPAWDLRLEFSEGVTLYVFSDNTDERDDAWVILGTDGLELGVRPRVRGDGGWEIKRSG